MQRKEISAIDAVAFGPSKTPSMAQQTARATKPSSGTADSSTTARK
jgi:hypothetical protein